jgi:hypothetical protein
MDGSGNKGGNVSGDPAYENRAPGDIPATEAAREEFQHQMLVAFEQGAIDASEYAARTTALEAAVTVADMLAVVARPVATTPGSSAGMSGPPAGTPGSAAVPPSLDPVDLARLMSPPGSAKKRSERSRYTALVAVIVLFALLLVAGLWLASHVHAAGAGSAGAGGFGVVAGAVVAGGRAGRL